MHKKSIARNLIATAGLLLATVLVQGCASAAPSGEQPEEVDYPTGPISYVVPFNPGGSTDPVGREFARMLAEGLGTTSIVENLPGGDETIGVLSVLEAEPDGQRIGLSSWSGVVVQPLVNKDLSYQGIDDYTPIVKMTAAPNAIVVAKDSPFETLDDLIDAAKDRPGEITVGSSGRLVNPTFALYFLEEQAGIDLNIVPFSGGASEAVLAVMGGTIDAAIPTASGQLGLIDAGDIRALAHTGDSAYDDRLPGSQSFEELGFDIPFSAEFVTVAPAGLDDAVREKLVAAAYDVVSSDEWAQWCEDNGLQSTPLQGAELTEWLEEITVAAKDAIALVEASEQ